jgi:Flp pilus assembly protein TadD
VDFHHKLIVLGLAWAGVIAPSSGAQSLQDRAAQYDRDRAEIDRLEATRPEREAAARAAEAQAAADRAADEDRYQAGQRRAMDAIRLREYRIAAWDYATQLYAAHDFQSAIAAFNTAEAAGETGYLLYLYRAVSKAHVGRYAEALQEVDAVAARPPKDAFTMAVRGEVLEAQGDLAGAAAAFDAAVAFEPKHFAPLYWRGVLRIRQGDYAGAVDDLTRADVAYGTHPDVPVALAVAKAALAGSPPGPDTLLYATPPKPNQCDHLGASPIDDTRPAGVAGVSNTAIDAPAVILACTAQLKTDPADARARFNLARALVMSERCAEGAEMLQQAIAGGSGAAAYGYARLGLTKCASLAPADTAAMMEKAVSLKNAAAALSIYQEIKAAQYAASAANNKARSDALYDKAKPYELKLVAWYGQLAQQGDPVAIAMLAKFAHDGVFNSNQVPKIMACKVRSLAICKDY